MKRLLYIGRISGIPVYLHWTFIVLFCWIFFYTARGNYTVQAILAGLQFMLCLSIALVLHEAAHLATANYLKWKTCAISFLPFGGISRTENHKADAGHQLLYSLAGPLLNLVAALGAWLLFSPVQYQTGSLTIQSILSQRFWFQFTALNFFIGLFNLIPALPMDGGRMVCALSSASAKGKKVIRMCLLLGQLVAIGFMLYGFGGNSLMLITGLFVFSGVRLEAGIEEANEILNNIIKVKGVARSKTWKPIHD